ncbi:N-6 DNA methylase, partial [candidate division WOR-3 bacterium]|nr:N-6 DNA methylase [candidate division WOR-3 bacterium]
NTFNHSFDENRFSNFIRNLFNDIDESKKFEYRGSYIPDSFKEHIKQYKRVGKYTDPENNELDVLIVYLKQETSLERARTMQRNFVAWYLKNRGEKDAAVVAYHTDNPEDWRFSYVKMEYRQEITEDRKVKVREKLTPARRYSFLVGKNEPNHTAQQQLFPILKDDYNNPSLEDLEKAFSVEAVTKQFYQDYRILFQKLTTELSYISERNSKLKEEFESKSIDTTNFSKKLLGQIVFLYFLQKKGWLGVRKNEKGDFKPWGTGPKNFLRQLFEKQFTQYDNFFNDVLEPLFYEALATERTNDYYSRFNCKIPFLNGGLFEPIGDYNWQETDILFNNNLFTEVFDTFDLYNFTVREDEPLEREVAVDPEILGKVFEKLGAINDKNFDEWKKIIRSSKKSEETKFNKRYGAYYTPREIVHYMCQQSLINYLDTAVNIGEVPVVKTPALQKKIFGKPDPEQTTLKTTRYKTIISKEDIEELVRKGEFAVEHDIAKEEGTKSYKYQVPESIRKNAKVLDEKLASIKVCDPAIGSGAFPVGMMHEIVKARNVLTTYLDSRTNRSIYEFKRDCIQDSLYGVDIDPGGIDIAKLRLWLSLVVDEDEYYKIKPLPNLDYKIMQGNSLIEDFHGVSLSLDSKEEDSGELFKEESKLDKLIKNLHEKQNALFNATHHSDKERLKGEVEDAIINIFHHELKRRQTDYFRELRIIEESASRLPRVKSQKEYYAVEKAKLDKKYDFDFEAVENELREMTHGNKVRSFFPWKLYFADVFQQNGGFDIMIANPPYIFARDSKSKGLNESEKEYFYKKYKLAKYQINTYPLFIESAHLQLKQNGILTFITPNNWLTINTNRDLRKFILDQSNIIVVNFYAKVFESANVDSSIIIYEKSRAKRAMISLYEYETSFELIKDCDTEYFKKQNDFIINIESLKDSGVADLLFKIEEKSIKLGGISDVKVGLKVYQIGKGKPPQTKHVKENRVFHSTQKKGDNYLKYLDGKNVCRYYIEWSSEYLKYGKHLAEPRNNFELFSSERILVRQIPSKQPYSINACLTDEVLLNDLNSMNIINIQISPSFVLAVLNSKLTTFWFIHKFGKLQRGLFPQFKVNELKLFPIPDISKDARVPISNIANQILSIKKSKPSADTSKLEDKIDRMVYDLYDLTPDEIAIVKESSQR